MAWWLEIPFSTIIITAIAFSIVLFSLLMSRRFIDIKMWKLLREQRREYLHYLRQYRRTGDKQLRAKLKKREKQVWSIQKTLMRQQMRLSMMTTFPLLLVIIILGGFPLLGIEGIYPLNLDIAYLPFRFYLIEHFRLFGYLAPKGTALNFFGWYIICSFAFHLVLSRIFGYY
jgi:uncharacterized membrane protein (DUF106 family)